MPSLLEQGDKRTPILKQRRSTDQLEDWHGKACPVLFLIGSLNQNAHIKIHRQGRKVGCEKVNRSLSQVARSMG